MAIKAPERGSDIMKKERITLRKRGQLTLPKSFMEELHLHEGDSLELQLDDNGKLTLVPLIQVPADQAWFWTEKWQKEEKEAQQEIEEGRIHSFTNIETAFNWLDSEDEK